MSHVQAQALDIPGVSEYTEASNMVRNRIFYIHVVRYEVSKRIEMAH